MKLEIVKKTIEETFNHDTTKINPLVEITVANGCNKCCSYCFENDHKFSRDLNEEKRQLEILEDLCMKFDHDKFGRLNISFWGGEPFLNTEFMANIIEKTIDYEFVDYFAFSNGTLTNNIRQILEDYHWSKKLRYGRFNIQLSYDGEPHHSLKRGYGTNEIFQTIGVLQKNHIGFNFKATLASDSLHLLPYCWDSYEQLFLKYGEIVRYAPAIDTTNDLKNIDYSLMKKIFIEIAKRELLFIKKYKHPLMTWFYDGKHFCDIRNSVHLHSDGNLYCCHGAPYLEKQKSKDFIVDCTSNKALDLNDSITNLCNIDTYRQPNQCITCDATFCGICHISLVEQKKWKKDWMLCMPKNQYRCKIYQEFGKIHRALNFVLLETKKSK